MQAVIITQPLSTWHFQEELSVRAHEPKEPDGDGKVLIKVKVLLEL
jgi:hypothetical protein